MNNGKTLVSNAFQVFMSEAPKHAETWMSAVQGLDEASADPGFTSCPGYI